MKAPTEYARTATFKGVVSAFSKKLDPQLWEANAPEIWNQSYVIATPAVASVLQGPALSLAKSALVEDRNLDPRRDQTPGGLKAWGPPGDGLFFEDVMVAGFQFRNVLKTSYVDTSGDPTAAAPRIRFDYRQYDCLTTDSAEPAQGGIDVDHGFSECVEDPENPGQIILSIAKTVRFTQPAFCVDELNALASITVPLSFDSWLHDMMFL